jgi:adenine-specific DNA-methyltransferase
MMSTGVIPIPNKELNKCLWTPDLIDKIKIIIRDKDKETIELIKPLYKTVLINNRRYLGNKFKLISIIKNIVETECSTINTVADIFAGTGVVASAFTHKKIITNDILYCNYICHYAWFSSDKHSKDKIVDNIEYYNSIKVSEDNYMSENYADTFFSKQVCRKIGFVREDIERLFQHGEINQRERAILITSLLYAMDKIANTCGHYDAFRRGAKLTDKITLCVPIIEDDLNQNNQIYNTDTNELVKSIEADLVYIDPPYNSRQYCDAYHLLENVARWEKPPVEGVAKKMDRSLYKSDYCTIKATKAFESLINNIKAKYILLSYNNMAEKGNDRSNAKISDDDIYRILKKKGTVKVFTNDYRAFTAGKSSIAEHQERLFLCTCYDGKGAKKELIPSPLNYIGGKFKLLPQILPNFPKDIDTFVDLFCGGCNVGINVDCSKVVFNDSFRTLLYLYNTFKNLDINITFEFIEQIIDKYSLSRSNGLGYYQYGCSSTDGLGKYNRKGFLKLRTDFNDYKNEDYYYYVLFYVLIVYSFNNQIRFNRKGEFNLPVGKRDFNDKMKAKLFAFINRLKSSDYIFTSHDFRNYPIDNLTDNSLVYVDPPYLITCATYNEQGGWDEQCEKDLLTYLDKLHRNNIRFALSNVISSKGKKNTILCEWLENNQQKYRVIHLNYNYSNSNYQTKDKTSGSDEVLIINY